MTLKFSKRIADPIHGTINLTDLEASVIETPAFQRLRNVRHLGLAHYVFPGADYSRFSHSLGACHVIGRTLEAVQRNSGAGGELIDSEQLQRYRLAALLHDVGHYPFSHPMENAIFDFMRELVIEPATGESDAGTTDWSEDVLQYESFEHERVSKEVVEQDPDLLKVWGNFDFDPTLISSIIMGEDPSSLRKLLSSDLDADRVDYLLRTAHHSGLPYGAVDLDYILSQLVYLPQTNQVALSPKAVRAADHMLLCRYFDYRQVVFNKTVVGLELLLQRVLRTLLDSGRLNATARWVTNQVSGGKWAQFDDVSVMGEINHALEHTDDEILRLQCRSLLHRNPPRQVWSREVLRDRSSGSQENHQLYRDKLRNRIVPQLLSEFPIDERQFLEFAPQRGDSITKAEPFVMLTDDAEPHDEIAESIRIVTNENTEETELLVHSDSSLMQVLAQHAVYDLRLYVILPPGQEDLRNQISDRCAALMA